MVLRLLVLLSLLGVGCAHARGWLGSHSSVYFSSYCRQYRCVLISRTPSHTDGIDYLIYRYRLQDGSRLVVGRHEPYDRTEKRGPGDFTVASVSLELGNALTPSALERRLTELVNVSTGSAYTRLPFDFVHKCSRPGQAGSPEERLGILKTQTLASYQDERGFPVVFRDVLTCQRFRTHWRLYVHPENQLPLTDLPLLPFPLPSGGRLPHT